MWLLSRSGGDPDATVARLLPHLDAAYTLARWLMRDPARAEDVVQDAMLKAIEGAAGFRGGDPRAWLLRIVRNAAYDAMAVTRRGREDPLLDTLVDPAPDVERSYAAREGLGLLSEALERLPVEWREALVLREVEGMSYREIAAVTEAPIGTVMSRLSRGRRALLKLQEQVS